MTKPTVIVIGAGVIGLCTAWNLLKDGAEVTVISDPDPGHEINWASVAWSNASSKVRLKYPDHYTILNQQGMAAGRALAAELDTAPWLHVTGAVELVAGPEARARLEADLIHLTDFGYPIEPLSPDDLERVLPGVRIGDDETAVLFPTEAWIDAPALLSGLTGAISAAGGQFVRHAVTGFTRTEHSLSSVVLDDGTARTADHYVIAAGAWSGELGALADIDIPVLPATNSKVPGLVVAITSPEPGLGPIVVAPEIIIRPFGPGRAVLANDNHGHVLTLESPRSDLVSAANVLLGRAGARVPELADAAILDVRLGRRSIPSDSITIAGPAANTDNVYVLTTHSGFSLAPLLGRLASREILVGENNELLAPYRPSRFGSNTVPSSFGRVDSASMADSSSVAPDTAAGRVRTGV